MSSGFSPDFRPSIDVICVGPRSVLRDADPLDALEILEIEEDLINSRQAFNLRQDHADLLRIEIVDRAAAAVEGDEERAESGFAEGVAAGSGRELRTFGEAA